MERMKGNKMDLKNLQGPLLEGIRIPTDDGRVKIVTPVFRISYPHLDKPYAGDKGNWAPKYSVQCIFNAKNADIPARVNLGKVVFPAIQEIAKAAGLQYQLDNLTNDNYQGKEVPFMRGDNKVDGNGDRVPGYEDGTRFFNAKNKNKIALWDAGDPTKGKPRKPLDAEWFKPGYYARAVIGIYASNDRVCYGCEEVQLLARGELLGGGGTREYGDYMGATEGESFDGAPPADGPSESGTPSDDEMWDARGGY